MKEKIIIKDKDTLKLLIDKEMLENGNNCDLNHFDISNLNSIEGAFFGLDFNGDISQWDTSNIEDMSNLFKACTFNGDISNWNVSKVEFMYSTFYDSAFNGDISKWDVSNVMDMEDIFNRSDFNQDLTVWMPLKLSLSKDMFSNCPALKPYWSIAETLEERTINIQNYLLCKKLDSELRIPETNNKKIKI